MKSVLDGLFPFLGKAGQTPPVHEVSLLEISPSVGLDERGRIRVRRDELRAPDDYKDRFDELLAAGLPWINVRRYGLRNKKLIVAVELPAGGRSERAPRTSVNYSGPTKAAIEAGWDAAVALALE